MNQGTKTLLLWIVVILVVLLVWQALSGNGNKVVNLTFSEFMDEVEAGNIAEISIKGNKIEGRYAGGEKSFKTIATPYDDMVKILRKAKVNIIVEDDDRLFISILVNAAPFILLIAIWIYFMRQMQGGGNKAMSFGKSRARLSGGTDKKITFDDVAGVEEAKDDLAEIVDYLKDPKRFQKLGGKIPKGVLLVGPPGTGKTLLARAVSGEAGVPFFSISGSDFVEMFVGVGASRVRDLFEKGKKNAPCLIFIDELDAVGRQRGAGLGGGHDEREQTLNQLLVEMDGFETNQGVILLAATNRPDVLDPALLRPGRFDRRVVVDVPDLPGREGILEVHIKDVPVADDVDLNSIARGTPGFTGADLANLINEAALYAARKNKNSVEMSDFEYAKDKVLMGTERKSRIMNKDEQRSTAYHEAGHALAAVMLPNADPLHKVTIIPRGRALGLTMQLPLDDRFTYSKGYLEDLIAVALGGRVAEEIFLDHLTTGASNDLERISEIARKMVCDFGMSPELGPIKFGKKDEAIFLGREISTEQNFSQSTAVKIDEEINRIIFENYEKVRKLLTDNKDKLEQIAEQLLKREVLTGKEVEAIMDGTYVEPEPELPELGKEKKKKKEDRKVKTKTETNTDADSVEENGDDSRDKDGEKQE